MEAFLRALFECIIDQRTTLGICRLFNPKSKVPTRIALRTAWASLECGPPTIGNVDKVLKSTQGTILLIRGGRYTFGQVPRCGSAGKGGWGFREDIRLPDRFLAALCARMGNERLLVRDIYVLLDEDEQLLSLASNLTKRGQLMGEPITLMQLTWLLRSLANHRLADGKQLVRFKTHYLFV